MTDTAIRHVILGQPLSCFNQMMTASQLAEKHGAILHLTTGCIGKPTGKQPGMASDCMPLDPQGSTSCCRHDLAALRREGAIDITDSTECWTPDGLTCTTCHRGETTPAPTFQTEVQTNTWSRQPRRAASLAVQGALW